MPDESPKSRKFRLFKDHEVTVSTDIAEEWDKIKDHFRRNKAGYAFGAGVGVAGITFFITRGNPVSVPRVLHSSVPRVLDESKKITVTPLAFLSKQSVNTVTVFENDGPGRAGNLVRCLENGRYYPSQTKAATALGISQSNLSQHLNGLQDAVNGLHFERFAEKT